MGATTLRVLGPNDVTSLIAMLDLFAAAFEDPDAYSSRRPGEAYLRRLLASDAFIALAAERDGELAGAIAAYELVKFEQERSEIYIYDLAVDETHRRLGIASAMIERLREIARERGADVVFVQADEEDEPAVALYAKLGTGRVVRHFDFEV